MARSNRMLVTSRLSIGISINAPSWGTSLFLSMLLPDCCHINYSYIFLELHNEVRDSIGRGDGRYEQRKVNSRKVQLGRCEQEGANLRQVRA
ncbi:hypothetical protein EJ04DRAFT_336302 [Polyplosphaeria fusca]|uniref:Uncharacterized protein n=1 Tax=Polyplosphaeria fusca TaxID=682080 RepID=A0A9P4QU53_9PLEO|nr:hypothetical protein EJ04DRAFT_336302 [Polyplosphaeria fusca]